MLPKLGFEPLLQSIFAESTLEDYMSPATKQKTTANRRTRMASFPRYLALCVNKFYQGADWTAKKYEVSLQPPEELDLGAFRGTGLQAGEEELPEDDVPAAPGKARGNANLEEH